MPRALLAVAVGATVTTIGAYAVNARTSVPISSDCPTRRTTSATARTSSTSCSSTSAPGTRSARSRCCWWRRPVSRRLVFRNRRFGSAPRVSDAPAVTADSSASHSRDHVAARRRPHRSETPVAGPRGDHPADLPDDHGVVGLLLLRRSQRTRRRVRRRPHGRSRAGPAVPRRRPLRTRRNRPDRRGQDPRRSGSLFAAGTALASLFLGAPALSSAIVRGDAAADRPRQDGHRPVLRPGCVLSSWSVSYSTCCAVSAHVSTHRSR